MERKVLGPPTGYFLADCPTRTGVVGFAVYLLDFETNFSYYVCSDVLLGGLQIDLHSSYPLLSLVTIGGIYTSTLLVIVG